MKRFYIFEGDKTSSGGTTIASQDHSTWHGRKYIMLDDKVYCPACKKIGTIVGQGARLNDNWMGQHPALNDDICVCDCRPAPKLIAYQDSDWQMMTTEEVAAQGYGSQIGITKQAIAESSDELLEQYFEIVGAYQQTPEDYRYDLLEGKITVQKSKDLSSGRTISHKSENLNAIIWLNKSGTFRS